MYSYIKPYFNLLTALKMVILTFSRFNCAYRSGFMNFYNFIIYTFVRKKRHSLNLLTDILMSYYEKQLQAGMILEICEEDVCFLAHLGCV